MNKSFVHRLFYPVTPVIITAESEGIIGGMPANSCMPLSFNPQLIGLSVNPEHRTHTLISESNYFCVNWINRKHSPKMELLASRSGEDVKDKLSAAGFSVTIGRTTPLPVLKEAVAVVECKVKERHVIGDHDLFVAEGLDAYASPDFGKYWRFKNYWPILYTGSTKEEKFKMLSLK